MGAIEERAVDRATEMRPAMSAPTVNTPTADLHQGQVFLGILHREADAVTAAIETAETCAKLERSYGATDRAQRYENEARQLWRTLHDLHRMIRNLRTRFSD